VPMTNLDTMITTSREQIASAANANANLANDLDKFRLKNVALADMPRIL